jgi:uncharacterized membrane protein
MTSPLIWGSPEWMFAAFGLLAVIVAALLWSYARSSVSPAIRASCAFLKGLGLTALVLSLIEPLLTGTRPRRGANAFAIVADNSQSLLIRDEGEDRTRGERLRTLLDPESPWQIRLGQDFDVRRYLFDTHLRAVEHFDDLRFDGTGSALTTSLGALARRFHGLPLAGVLLLTDGNRTDFGEIDVESLPPIYPVVPFSGGVVRDVSVGNVTVSQTNFEAAPVVVRADVTAIGFKNEPIVAALIDEQGQEIERQQATATDDGQPLYFRFQFRPVRSGITFYTIRAFAASDEAASGLNGDAAQSVEQTLANNERLLVVDQGGGPYRVLYVGGRPNWDFKFLRRAIDEDDQLRLIGLLRIARKQPKFDFQSKYSRSTSPLYQGFDLSDPETAESADEPVLIRLGTEDEAELRDGFPKTADDLYRYHAIILDDVEATFFTPDQLALLRNFVSVRGGGLLMMGGPDSLADGKYDRTPVAELLPIYLNRTGPVANGEEYRLVLTREGWLQPWIRTRKTEDDERRRLAAMPTFQSLSREGSVKPGAAVLAEVRDRLGETAPALVAQRFGKGQSAALMIGDWWRWQMRRRDPAEDDFDRAWRQTVRWLVADVPRRVEIDLRLDDGATAPALRLTVRVRDPEYRPLDNANVVIKVTVPGGDELTLDAEPAGREPGAYAATYVTRDPGAYRFTATATAADGSSVGRAEAGWAAQPAADEFARLEPDREYLASLAAATGGEVIAPHRLEAFVASLESRDAPITEPWTSPLWHHPLYFLLAIVCLTAEWGLRRLNGLP